MQEMKEREKASSASDGSGLVEALRVAVTLGYPAPTFPNSIAYRGVVNGYEGVEHRTAIYDSHDAVNAAITNWCISEWNDRGRHPLFPEWDWDEDNNTPDYSGFTDEAIRKAFFHMRPDWYIEEVKIKGIPARENKPRTY